MFVFSFKHHKKMLHDYTDVTAEPKPQEPASRVEMLEKAMRELRRMASVEDGQFVTLHSIDQLWASVGIQPA